MVVTYVTQEKFMGFGVIEEVDAFHRSEMLQDERYPDKNTPPNSKYKNNK